MVQTAPILSTPPESKNVGNLSALEKLKAQIVKNKEQSESNERNIATENQTETQNEPLNIQQFKEAYETYLNQLENGGKARLAAFLKESPYEWKEPATAIIELKSEMELEMINEERLDFMPWFRSKLKNTSFEIEFTVNKNRIVNLSRISKSDQLKKLIEKQPILAEYVQHLGLEIDY